MPILLIRTNVRQCEIPKTIIPELTDLISDVLNRSKAGVCVIIQADQWMGFSGDDQEPCASCIIQDFEHFSVDENKRISKALMAYLYEALNVNSHRMFLEFAPVEKQNIGFNATTFHEIFGPDAGGFVKDSVPGKDFKWPGQ